MSVSTAPVLTWLHDRDPRPPCQFPDRWLTRAALDNLMIGMSAAEWAAVSRALMELMRAGGGGDGGYGLIEGRVIRVLGPGEFLSATGTGGKYRIDVEETETEAVLHLPEPTNGHCRFMDVDDALAAAARWELLAQTLALIRADTSALIECSTKLNVTKDGSHVPRPGTCDARDLSHLNRRLSLIGSLEGEIGRPVDHPQPQWFDDLLDGKWSLDHAQEDS